MISIIIPILNLQNERLRNFNFVLSKIKDLGIPIIICEQILYENGGMSIDCEDITHYKINIPDKNIHKSKLINFAVDQCSTEYFWVIDADFFIDYQKVLAQVDFKHKVYKPFSTCYYLHDYYTEQLISGKNFILPTDLQIMKFFGPLSFIYEKNAFLSIGGLNEEFKGWGYEDIELAYRTFHAYEIKEINLIGMHLFHPPTRNQRDENNKLFKKLI